MLFARRAARARSTSVKMRDRKRSPCRSITFSMRRMSVMSLPMPMIMSRSRRLAQRVPAIHRGAHRVNGAGETAEDRLADQEVPDVEFDDLREGRDDLRGIKVEAVPGVALEPQPLGARHPCADALQFGDRRRRMPVG